MKEQYTNTENLPILLTVTQASKLLNVSRSELYALLHSNSDLPRLMLSPRLTRIPKDALLAWIETHTTH